MRTADMYTDAIEETHSSATFLLSFRSNQSEVKKSGANGGSLSGTWAFGLRIVAPFNVFRPLKMSWKATDVPTYPPRTNALRLHPAFQSSPRSSVFTLRFGS